MKEIWTFSILAVLCFDALRSNLNQQIIEELTEKSFGSMAFFQFWQDIVIMPKWCFYPEQIEVKYCLVWKSFDPAWIFYEHLKTAGIPLPPRGKKKQPGATKTALFYFHVGMGKGRLIGSKMGFSAGPLYSSFF